MKGFVGGIPIALLAVAAQAMEHGADRPMSNGVEGHRLPQAGATVMGGPSGNDDDGGFTSPYSAKVNVHVNDYSEDDHSIDVKDTDVYLPSPLPMPYGVAMAPGMGPFEEDKKKRHEPMPATVIGGPSGDDEGQVFNMPITVDTHTDVNEYYQDDHSIDLKHTDVFTPPPMPPFGGPGPVMPEGGLPPFRRAYSPSSTERTEGGGGGGTAEGGPSGEDGGINFGMPNSVDVDSNVNEHHEDNHAIQAESTDVHAIPHMPWMHYHAPQPPQSAVEPEAHHAPSPVVPEAHHASSPVVPEAHHAPSPVVPEAHHAPSPVEHEAPACEPQVHEVVRTVTVTETPAEHVVQTTQTIHDTKTLHDTVTITQTAKGHVVQVTETVYVTPKPHVVEVTDTVYATPTSRAVDCAIRMSAIANQTPASKILYSSIPTMPSSPVYKCSPRPTSSNAAYSVIPVQVREASSSMSMPMPSGADPMRSQMASASATPSKVMMFTGAAPRLAGGIASAAAAVMGVLAFIL